MTSLAEVTMTNANFSYLFLSPTISALKGSVYLMWT